MARLTEEMIIARSKQSDLTAIKKLNCWCVLPPRWFILNLSRERKKKANKFLCHLLVNSLSHLDFAFVDSRLNNWSCHVFYLLHAFAQKRFIKNIYWAKMWQILIRFRQLFFTSISCLDGFIFVSAGLPHTVQQRS